MPLESMGPGPFPLFGSSAALEHQDDEMRDGLLVTLTIDVVRETVGLKGLRQDGQLFRIGDCTFSEEHVLLPRAPLRN
jgi:hypothetical protein